MKDKALENLFLAQRPVFDDKDEFMAQLTHKLDAVEYLRQYEEANLRRYKYAMIATFAMGIIVGGIMLVFVLTIPDDVPLLSINVTSENVLIIEHSKVIASAILALFLGLGVMSIINNVLDIVQMGGRLENLGYGMKE